MNKLEIDKHLLCSRLFKKQLDLVAKPLFAQSMVKYFSYNRYFRNKKWIGLYTDADPVEKTLAMDLGPIFLDEKGVAIKSGVYFHGDLQEIIKTQVLAEHVESFFAQDGNPKGQTVVQNGLLIIRKGELYDESFYFSMYDASIASSRTYYYQSLNMLKKFCLYFLHKCRNIIDEAENHKISYAIPPSGKSVFEKMFWKDESTVINPIWFDSRKFCIGTQYGDVFLSNQELNCLRMIAHGFTYNEIAEQLSLQYKTVESYVQNLKSKLTAESRSELAQIYREFSVLDVNQMSH